MKLITIKIAINNQDDKIATSVEAEGLKKDSISDQLELLGILENTKNIIVDKIKKLAEKG